MMRLLYRLYGLLISLLVLSVAAVSAQGNCPAVVQSALENVDTNCVGLDRNNACYGYDQVQASFVEAVPDDFFSQPADRADLLNLETLTTSPLNVDAGTWGVSVMKLQANVPNALPGQALTFVLLGDTEVENAVDPDEAASSVTPLDIEVTAGANIRSGPGTNFNVIAGAPRGTLLPADGRSEDGDWLRVVFRGRVGWVNRIVLEPLAAIDDLPAVDPVQRSPMQAFYLRTNTALPACDEAPDVLMVQGPRNLEVDLTVNGVNVRIGSTILIRQIADDVLEFIVLDGKMSFLDENLEPTTILYEDYRSTVCLSPPDDRGLDGEANDQEVSCPPSAPEYVGPSPLGIDWCELEGVPGSVLNYEVNLLCPGETPPPPPSSNTGSGSSGTNVDCSTFRLISPLEPVDPRFHDFIWTASEGPVQYYNVLFRDYQGNLREVFATTDTEITLNVGQQISSGSGFSWYVISFDADGNIICETPASGRITRLPDPNPPPIDNAPAITFDFDVVCELAGVGIEWSDLPAGEILEAYALDESGGTIISIFVSNDNGDNTNGQQLVTGQFVQDIRVKFADGGYDQTKDASFCF